LINEREQIQISGKPADAVEVSELLARPPKEPVYVDFRTGSGWITLQPHLVNRCWQVFRTLPDGGVEFTVRMLTPDEAVDWWQSEAGNPVWYAEQSWRRESSDRKQLLRRLILLLLAGLILVAAGIALISAGLAR
jgi:hypothetical protein